MNRRQFTQASLALAVTPGLGVARSAGAAPALRSDSIQAAIVQSRARTTADVEQELATVLAHSRKDLVCFPALDPVDVTALRGAGVFVAVNDTLITPRGDVLRGEQIYDTDIGRIAFAPSFDAAPGVDAAPAADILIHLTASPVSFVKAQALAMGSGAHVIAATPVGDAFWQASGSVMFSPAGEVLAAAGAAWTQTLSATLHIIHWRGMRAVQSALST
jgi:hypothetical protein